MKGMIFVSSNIARRVWAMEFSTGMRPPARARS